MVAPPDRDAPEPAFGPGQDDLVDQDVIAIDVDSLAFDTVENAFGKQYLKWAIGIHHVFGVGDPHGHLVSIAPRDRVELGRSFEISPLLDSNSKSQADTDRLEVDDATGRIRTFIILEAALTP